jgi:DNA-binding GntR family transcriptional regulator
VGIEYVTKHDSAYRQIKNEIIEGKLLPGQRLVIADLASRYGVSPMPVREALVRLQQDELVISIPHVGAQVAQYNITKAEEIAAIRVELEAMAARLATVHIKEGDIALLEDMIHKMELDGKNQFREYGKLNREFHEWIYSKCNNQQLIDLIMSLREKAEIVRTVFRRSSEQVKDSLIEHREWLDAIKERDSEKASTVLRIHLKKAYVVLFEALRKEPGRK